MALNILIVDDSQTVRSVIAKTLRLAELPIGELLEASNGAEALELLGAHWVDLVFSDINMPVMGGMELIDRMRDDETHASTPVIVVSTEGSTTRIEELKAKNIDAYIRKPFSPEQLREVVDQVLGFDNENRA